MKSKLFLFCGVFTVVSTFCQSDYINRGDKQYQLLERLAVKFPCDSLLNFGATKPYNRKLVTEGVEQAYSSHSVEFSKTDLYNMRQLLISNAEWINKPAIFFHPKKSIFFYKTPAHFYTEKGKDFFVSIDPLLNIQTGKSNDGTGNIFTNSRGVLIKGHLNKVGFYTSVTDNQERDPKYVRNFTDSFWAVPGQGFFKHYKTTGFDFLEGRGGITFSANKYFSFAFAYDNLFIGDGYRSLILSDFASPYLFFKINTKFWKINYENIFAELNAPFANNSNSNNTEFQKKYLALHRLSMQLNKWLNIGLFETVTLKGQHGLELNYLNPVIYFRSAEQELGSPDKVSDGIDFKISRFKNIRLYGQLLINELHINEIKRYSRGSWYNKHALQLGADYVDAFGIKNLDIQAEMNIVRPFTYTHDDSATAYTHFNQPLAHPLGAGFREFIVIAKYQPLPKLFIEAKIVSYKQGLDSNGKNYGSNLLRSYLTRAKNEGLFVGSGVPVKTFYAGLNISYELFNNLFLDFNAVSRNYHVQNKPADNVLYYSIGVRMNMARREFVF